MRKFYSTLLLLLISLVSYGQANFSIEDFKIQRGETKSMPIKMEVTSPVQAFQLDLVMPEGVTVTNQSAKLTSWGSMHTISQAQRTDGKYRMMVYTMLGGVFDAGKDDIITVEVTAADDCSLGNKNFNISGVVVTPVSGTKQKIELIENIGKVYEMYSVSASSADEKMGSVTIEPSGDEVENGTSVTATAIPNAGYSFVNWTNAEDVEVSKENVHVFELVAPIALTANFKANQYNVAFKNDGVVVTEGNLDFASVITAPEAEPTKVGYTFLGWYNGETKFEAGVTVPVDGVTYEAKWQINQYTITFDTDGGSEVAAITADYNTAVTAPANPTKTGYTFKGWDKEIPSTIPAEDITIKATWEINQYTITFDTDGGSEVAAITADYNTAVKAPENPTKTGYTFVAWDKEIPTTIPAEDVTIKAQWQINQYTITFDTDGGSEVAAIKQDYNTAVTAPANPTKTGYTFVAWDKEIPATIPAEDVTIKAQWQINQYTITFDTDGGSEVAAIKQDYNTAVTAPANPTKTGYTFVAWDKEIPATIPAEDITIKATWEINQYTITFDTDGGTEIAAITQDYNTEVTAPADPTKTGYTFVAWDKEIPATIPAEDMTIKATWQINQYTITFDTDGGTAIDPITQDYNTPVTAPADPTKTGYTFAGWDKEIPATMPAGNVTVKASWTINQYAVKFVSDDVDVQSETLDYGATITAPADPEKTGYTFKGWSPAFEEGSTVPAEDVTYTAVWQINQYTITFDTDGGTEIAAITQDYNTEVTAPENPTKTGYTFVAWDKEIPATMPAEDVTIKAQWQINQYTITFDTDGGSEVAAIKQDYNTAVTAPANPTKTGYTFKGWDKEIPATMPAEDVTIKAQWQINQYTITFDTDGGSEVAAIKQDYNTAVTAPATPTKTGYTFKGWDKEIPATMPAEDVTIKAQWQINQYTVKFVSDEDVVYEETLDYGTTITAPDAPVKEGYTFEGWSPEVLESVPDYDVTFTAQFKVNVYTLTYYLDGEAVFTEEVEYGSAVEIFTPELEEGKTFNGWQEEIPEVMPAHDVEIHGTTSAIPTGITNIVANGGGKVSVYNLQGRLVVKDADAKRVNELPAGCYIINGVKCQKK